MIAALTLSLAILAPPQTPSPDDLSYLDTYMCMRLGQIAQVLLTGDGARAPSDQGMFDTSVVLERGAQAALDPARVREGALFTTYELEHGAGEELLDKMTAEQKADAIQLCVSIFAGAGR